MTFRIAVAALVALGLLGGCAELPLRRGAPPSPDAPVPAPILAPDQTPGPSATGALLDQAAAALAGGDRERAASILERAIRVEPGNPLPWSRLAGLRLSQGQWRQAEQLAVKSNQLAGADLAVAVGNWRIIADSRRRSGDEDGARVAEREADRLDRR